MHYHNGNMLTTHRNVRTWCSSELVVQIHRNPGQICKNCKHYRPVSGLCTHRNSTWVNLVNGKILFNTAVEMRHSEKACGLNARYFEKKDYSFPVVDRYDMKLIATVCIVCLILLSLLCR
jgi:hypothetical protein